MTYNGLIDRYFEVMYIKSHKTTKNASKTEVTESKQEQLFNEIYF